MISRLHPSFRRDFDKLPREIQQRAKAAYKRFQDDPSHPALQFKPLNASIPLWSVRISKSYRAVGIRKSKTEIIWFFIGSHADYERLLDTL